MPAVRMPASQPISQTRPAVPTIAPAKAKRTPSEAERQQDDHADAADGQGAEFDHRASSLAEGLGDLVLAPASRW